MPLVGVVMGSKSDTEVVQATLDVLKQLGIEWFDRSADPGDGLKRHAGMSN